MYAVLEELLLRARIIDVARMKRAKDVVQETGCTLAHALVKLGLVSDRALAEILSEALSLRVIDPTRLDVASAALAALAGPVAHRLRVLPVRLRSTADGEFIYIAMSDPTDTAAVHEVEATTGREVVPAVAEEKALERALRKYYPREVLTPVRPPSLRQEPDPPVIMGVLEGPREPRHPAEPQGESARAALGLSDDGEYFTESTEELMTVYSKALARAEAGAEDQDLAWLQERREMAGEEPPTVPYVPALKPPPAPADEAVWPPKPALASPPDTADFDDVQTAPIPASELSALSAPPREAPRVVPLPVDDLTFGDRTEPDLVTARGTKQALFRPPTCVVATEAATRASLRARLAGHLADLHVEPTLDDAVELGAGVPLGYVVIIAPQAEPRVAKALHRLGELAGAPRVVIVGGDPAFQVVPGVERWIDAVAVGEERLAEAIAGALRSLEGA